MGKHVSVKYYCDKCGAVDPEPNWGGQNSKFKVAFSVPFGYMGEPITERYWLCFDCTYKFHDWMKERS